MSLEETLDDIVGDWKIYQLRRGHRFSTDDQGTAWLAARWRPDARRLLDLGAGLGSVGLMTLWAMDPAATLVMVEAQQISHALAVRTVALNGLDARVQTRLGDLRDPESVPEQAHFDLITGSPPYFPLGTAILSSHPQRAACRSELRGDIFDYCATAARALAPDGAFVFCHASGDKRPEAAVAAAGLALKQRIDVHFRAGRPPTISLFATTWSGERLPDQHICVRDASGTMTPEWLDLRAEVRGEKPRLKETTLCLN